MKHMWSRLAIGAVGLLAVAGLIFAGVASPDRSLEERTREVAQTLKCLTCIGEDVADSTAPVAAAMRISISERLEQGKSPEEIRGWFADRYGAEVLLNPPMSGMGSLMWILPALLVGFGAWFLLRHRLTPARRRRGIAAAVIVAAVVVVLWRVPQHSGVFEAEPVQASSDTEALLSQAVEEHPGDVSLHMALARELERQERHDEAAAQYAAASRLAPFNLEAAYLQASALVRSGAPESAVPLLEGVLANDPNHSPSLLLLGTLQTREGDAAGVALLERFLSLNTDHPATDDVRELIGATTGEG